MSRLSQWVPAIHGDVPDQRREPTRRKSSRKRKVSPAEAFTPLFIVAINKIIRLPHALNNPEKVAIIQILWRSEISSI